MPHHRECPADQCPEGTQMQKRPQNTPGAEMMYVRPRPYLHNFAMDQIFLWSALTWSSCLAIDVFETSSALKDPDVLAFWASLQFDISAWTLHIACAYDWELGIIAAVFMSHLGNVFTCLLDVLYKFFSSRPTKASTVSMNTPDREFLFFTWML